MLKGKFQERTVELKWAQEPSVTLQFWFRSEMAQTSEQCFRSNIWRQMRKSFPKKTKPFPTGVKNVEEKVITHPKEKKTSYS